MDDSRKHFSKGNEMKPIRKRLEEARKETGLPWEIIENDYILSWILAGIATNKALKNEMIFKGGTALKKCYFGDYRFSEDLDFSLKNNISGENILEQEIKRSCKVAVDLVQKFSPLELKIEKYTEKQSHPDKQEAFTVRGKFPWHRDFFSKAKIEITTNEPIIMEPKKRNIIHGYQEDLSKELSVYSLEEIISEKLRAILQHLKKLEQRGWTRSRARDYYDLWRIFNAYNKDLNLNIIPSVFLKKCEVKDIDFSGADAFFDERLLTYIADTWNQWLGPLVPDLPEFQLVIDDLREKIYQLF